MAERQGIEPYGETPWRKALTGGSDDHSGLFAASAYTEAGGDGTPQGFLRAVAAGDCTHGGIDGDSRTLAHSIYAASFWKIREILRLDEHEEQKRALSLLRRGFGRIGRDVPVLEKTLSGVRSMAPGLYRDGDPRGPSWEELLDREIGSLLADPDGINAVDARELNRRIFVVAQRLADDVMGLHLRALLDPQVRLSLKQRLQSLYAVGMVAFLEIPYYFAWSFQTKDRLQQEQLRVYFLGERRHTQREKIAVLCGWPDDGDGRSATAGPERRTPPAPLRRTSTSTSRWSPARSTARRRRPAWPTSAPWPGGPRLNGDGPSWVVPPLVEVADFIEEEGFSAVHTDSSAGQGLVALAAARLLHLPVTGAVDPARLAAPRGPGDVAGRLRRRYAAWFYGKLDEAFAPSREAARTLVAAGVDPSRITVVPAAPSRARERLRPARTRRSRRRTSMAHRRLHSRVPIPLRRAARRSSCAPRAGSRAPSARRRRSRSPRPASPLPRAGRRPAGSANRGSCSPPSPNGESPSFSLSLAASSAPASVSENTRLPSASSPLISPWSSSSWSVGYTDPGLGRQAPPLRCSSCCMIW